MTLTVVEDLDVIEQDRAEFAARVLLDRPPNMADLGFECRPESFHRGIVEAITDAAIRPSEASVIEAVRELNGCVLTGFNQ